MSRQRMIDTAFWTDPYIQLLDPSEKLVFLYLLSNPQANICGVYEITDRQTAFDTGFSIEVVRVCFQRFERDGRLMRAGNWVAFRNWIKHQAKAPGVQEGIRKQLAEVPPELADYARGSTPVQPGLTPVEPTSDLIQSDSEGEGDLNADAAQPQPAATPTDAKEERPSEAFERVIHTLDDLSRQARGRPFKLQDKVDGPQLLAATLAYGPDVVIAAFRRYLDGTKPDTAPHWFVHDLEAKWLRLQRPRAPQGPLPLEGLERARPEDLADLVAELGGPR